MNTAIEQLKSWRFNNQISEHVFINAKYVFEKIETNHNIKPDIKYYEPKSAIRMVNFLEFVVNDNILKNMLNYYLIYRIAFVDHCALFYYNDNRPVINGFIFDEKANSIHKTDDRYWVSRNTKYEYQFSLNGFLSGARSAGYNY